MFHGKTRVCVKYFVQDCCRRILCPTKSVKHLDIKTDENLNWKDISMILQMHNCIRLEVLLIFMLLKKFTHTWVIATLNKGKTLIVWLTYFSTEKVWSIINNQPRNSDSSPLFEESNILKFQDKILIGKLLLISKSGNNQLPQTFKNWFIFCSDFYIMALYTNHGTIHYALWHRLVFDW